MCTWGRTDRRTFENEEGARFSYATDIVRDHLGAPVLSLSLPVKSRPYGEGLARTWFSGLLPEGKRLESVCREIGCSTADYYQVLSEIGWECAGAVSIVPSGASERRSSIADVPLTAPELARCLREAADANSSPTGPLVRVSLGGFQGKLCVILVKPTMDAGYLSLGEAYLPAGQSASTHILKPPPSVRHPGLVAGEA